MNEKSKFVTEKQPKRQSNTELVNEFMDFSKHGAMAQLFVMEAVSRYAEQVTRDEAETRRQMDGGLINPNAWIGTAKEWIAKTSDRS